MANDYNECRTVTLNVTKIGLIDENYIRRTNEQWSRHSMGSAQWNEINVNMSKFYSDMLNSDMDIKTQLKKLIDDPCVTFTDGHCTFAPGDSSFLVTLRGYKSYDSLFPKEITDRSRVVLREQLEEFSKERELAMPFKHETYIDSRQPKIKNVMFNDPATIVFWDDGTKTVVKCENEEFDKEKGLAMAFTKKMLGNKGRYFNEVKKWTKQDAAMEGEDPHEAIKRMAEEKDGKQNE